MTALRQEAFQLLKMVPEDNLFSVIQFLQAERVNQLSREQRLAEKRIAFNELLQLSKAIPDLDDEKELAQYREEKFGNANLNRHKYFNRLYRAPRTVFRQCYKGFRGLSAGDS